jgi:hypothetical protein
LTTGSPTILRFERGFTPVGQRPVVAASGLFTDGRCSTLYRYSVPLSVILGTAGR